MLKKLLLALTVTLMTVIGTQAGELSFGGGYMNGHSNAHTRCINPGFSFDVGYDWSLGKLALLPYTGLELKAGGILTYSNYETAYRLYASYPESDQKRESSVTLVGTLKPTLHVGVVSVFGLVGVGPDYGQPDGLDYGYTVGAGGSVRITDRVSFGVTSRNFYRHDTGFYKYTTGLITIKF